MTPARDPMDEPVLEHVSVRMSRTRGRDTKPELAVRRLLHAHGWRYRVNHRPVVGLRRTGDIVFTRRRLVVLIDGCFWHGCPQHFVTPRTRTDWWTEKIQSNRLRDAETTRLWEAEGWEVLRFWEHDDPDHVVEVIEESLKSLEARKILAGPCQDGVIQR